MSRIGALGILADMVNYAYLSLRGASARSAAKRAGERLAEKFPGCTARIVDEGCMRDGSEWISVRFDLDPKAAAVKCIRTYSAALYEDGVAFWRVIPEAQPPRAWAAVAA